MKPELKKQWVDALRSGDYKQGRRTLRTEDDKFCCLGVLCDIAGVKWKEREDAIHVAFFDGTYSDAVLPEGLSVAAGLPNDTPSVMYDGERRLLTALNDGGVSFATIAELIERDL